MFDVSLRLVPVTLRDTSGTAVSQTGVSGRALEYDIEVLLALARQTSRTSGLKKRAVSATPATAYMAENEEMPGPGVGKYRVAGCSDL